MAGKSLTMLAVGDVILEKPENGKYLNLVAPTFRKGDVVVGQGEVLFTDRGVKTFVENFPAPAGPSVNMAALADAGFNVITLAGNHAYDQAHRPSRTPSPDLKNWGLLTPAPG